MLNREVELYPIQNRIVDAARDAFRYHKRVILMAATGLGKTVIATWMIKQAVLKDKRVLFVCDRISLIEQTSDVFHHYGINHGIFQADNPQYWPELPVQIGSIQTLARRKQRQYDLIIFDECHTWHQAHTKIIEHNPDAFFLGLTATPFTKGLGKYFDTHIQPVPMKELIDLGYLSKFEIYGPATIDLTGVRTVAGDYKEDDLAEAADKPKLVADVVQTWKKLARGKKTIVFCVNVAHGRNLEKEFRKSGINAKEINGYMPKEGDEGAHQIIEDFRQNNITVLISCEMLVKGFDVPDVQCVQFATATKSPTKWIQACGRGLRTSPGKNMCRILDHGSNAERLGFPDDYEFLGLDDGKKHDKKNKKKDRDEPEPKRCPSCDFIKPAGVRKCPACQFEPQYLQDIETEDGDLEKLKRKARSEYTLIEKQSFLAQLNQFASEKGFREGKNGCYGWAIHKYAEKFGSEPANRLDWGKKEPVGEEVKKWIKHCFIKKAKSPAPEKCFTCRSEQFKIEQAGPHRKLSCAKCGRYIKFVNPDQEAGLRKKGQVV